MSFHSPTPPLPSTPLPNSTAFETVILHLVTHPSHVGWQLSHLPAVNEVWWWQAPYNCTILFWAHCVGGCLPILYKGMGGRNKWGGRTPHTERRMEGLEVAPAIKLHCKAQSKTKGHLENQAQRLKKQEWVKRLIWVDILLMSTVGTGLRRSTTLEAPMSLHRVCGDTGM